MKKLAVEWLVEQLFKTNNNTNDVKKIDSKSIIEQAKEMENQQQGYSEEDLKYAFDSGRVRLTFDKERPFVFKNYEEFIEQFKNK